ncbi:MAG: hypothetical protein IIC21_03620 [Chloroflexi bacterium]|nr:hypothetical protein [Chloroflexota bacterium]
MDQILRAALIVDPRKLDDDPIASDLLYQGLREDHLDLEHREAQEEHLPVAAKASRP